MQEMNILSTPKLKSKEEKYEQLNQEIHTGNPDPVHGKSWLGAGNRTWQENLGAVLCCDNSRKISRNQLRRRMKIDGMKEKPRQRL
jgi:hypothetical protein